MTRRDRLVELACLWQEIRADRPPVHRPQGDGQLPAARYDPAARAARIRAHPREDLAARY